MKDRLSVKEEIFNVLLENTNGFISVENIANEAYGPFKHPSLLASSVGLIKRSMSHAIAFGASLENPVIIIPLKDKVKPSKYGPAKVLDHFKILGYKIAGPEDSENINVVLNNKAKLVEAHRQTMIDFADLAVEKKFIEPSINNHLLNK